MAVILLIYSFVEGLLTNNADGSFFLKPILWLSYFLLFVSLMLKYLSSVLQRAAKLKLQRQLKCKPVNDPYLEFRHQT